MEPTHIKLLKKEEVADGTVAFHFEKPAGFNFKAGQWATFMQDNPPETDAEGSTRDFSLAVDPAADDIAFTTRMRDTAFKRVMKNMPEGSEISVDGPYGSFTLHNDASKPAVFLAGGIGITPFYSMSEDAATRQLPHHIFLFYSNRRPEDSAFLEELIALESKNPNYKFIGTMTEMGKSNQPWSGETGYITKELIQKYIPDLSLPIYYVAGPPGMVTAMRKMLNDAGVNDDNIRTEEFSGY